MEEIVIVINHVANYSDAFIAKHEYVKHIVDAGDKIRDVKDAYDQGANAFPEGTRPSLTDVAEYIKNAAIAKYGDYTRGDLESQREIEAQQKAELHTDFQATAEEVTGRKRSESVWNPDAPPPPGSAVSPTPSSPPPPPPPPGDGAADEGAARDETKVTDANGPLVSDGSQQISVDVSAERQALIAEAEGRAPDSWKGTETDGKSDVVGRPQALETDSAAATTESAIDSGGEPVATENQAAHTSDVDAPSEEAEASPDTPAPNVSDLTSEKVEQQNAPADVNAPPEQVSNEISEPVETDGAGAGDPDPSKASSEDQAQSQPQPGATDARRPSDQATPAGQHQPEQAVETGGVETASDPTATNGEATNEAVAESTPTEAHDGQRSAAEEPTPSDQLSESGTHQEGGELNSGAEEPSGVAISDAQARPEPIQDETLGSEHGEQTGTQDVIDQAAPETADGARDNADAKASEVETKASDGITETNATGVETPSESDTASVNSSAKQTPDQVPTESNQENTVSSTEREASAADTTEATGQAHDPGVEPAQTTAPSNDHADQSARASTDQETLSEETSAGQADAQTGAQELEGEAKDSVGEMGATNSAGDPEAADQQSANPDAPRNEASGSDGGSSGEIEAASPSSGDQSGGGEEVSSERQQMVSEAESSAPPPPPPPPPAEAPSAGASMG